MFPPATKVVGFHTGFVMKKFEIEGEILENFDGPVLDFDENEMAEKLSNLEFRTFDKVKITVTKI